MKATRFAKLGYKYI